MDMLLFYESFFSFRNLFLERKFSMKSVEKKSFGATLTSGLLLSIIPTITVIIVRRCSSGQICHIIAAPATICTGSILTVIGSDPNWSRVAE